MPGSQTSLFDPHPSVTLPCFALVFNVQIQEVEVSELSLTSDPPKMKRMPAIVMESSQMRNSRLVCCLTYGSNHTHMEDKTSVNSYGKHSVSQRNYRCAVCRVGGTLKVPGTQMPAKRCTVQPRLPLWAWNPGKLVPSDTLGFLQQAGTKEPVESTFPRGQRQHVP